MGNTQPIENTYEGYIVKIIKKPKNYDEPDGLFIKIKTETNKNHYFILYVTNPNYDKIYKLLKINRSYVFTVKKTDTYDIILDIHLC